MKRIYFICLMVCLCYTIMAQNNIRVSIMGPNKLPYASDTSSLKSVQLPGAHQELSSSKIPVSVQMEEIVVTGGYRSAQRENAVKIDVLKLQGKSLKSTPNFTEALTSIPGVDMISKGSGVSKPVIRGLSMNDILILNNGVRYENYQYSSHHPLGIDEFGVESVEVIKGPASLIYGSDAIGGVLNFIKEKPAPSGSIIGDYNLQLFSNTRGITQNFGMKGASQKLFGGFRIGGKSNADFLQGGFQYAPNSRFTEYSVKTNAGFDSKIGTFQLFYDFNQQKLGLVEEEALEEIFQRGRTCELYYQQLNTHLLSSQNTLHFGRTKLEVEFAYQNTELIHFGEEDTYELQMKLATLTYEAKFYLPSSDESQYIIGVQGLNQWNTNVHDRETILLPNATTNNYSAFVLAKKTFAEKLTLQTGIRFDTKSISTESVGDSGSASYRASLDKSYQSFSGSIGSTWQPTENLMFRINAAAAFRTPNLAELTSNGPHETRYEMGDNQLKPENAYELDLSLNYHKVNFTADVAVFYNSIERYIYISPTSETSLSGLPVYRYGQHNSFLYGGEANVHIHPKSLPWLHVETSISTVIGKQRNGDYIPFIPAHKWNAEVRAEKENLIFLNSAFISLNSSTAFHQENTAPDETPTAGYVLLGCSIGGKIKWMNQNIFLSIAASNILDKQYQDHLSTLKEVNLFNPGRNISLTLKIPIGFTVREKLNK